LLVNKILIAKFSGILIIIFGLMFLLEVFAQTPSKQDDKSKKCKLKKVFEFIKNNIEKSYNFNDSIRKIVGNNTGRLFASFLIGIAFAFGWSPCVGPVLASILTMAMNTNNTLQASLLLFVYSLGLGLPFLFASLFMGFFLKAFSVFKTKLVSEFIGVFLIIIGIIMLVNGHLPTL
jgi:cytochrome c-type biogenesis protein